MFHPQYLHNVMTDLIYSDLTYKINGILFTVHNQLGRYCNEKQYSDLIEKLLKDLKMDIMIFDIHFPINLLIYLF